MSEQHGVVPRWTDSHCHSHDGDDRHDPFQVLRRAGAAGVARAVLVGTDPASSRRAVALSLDPKASESGVELLATVGLHPHDARLGADTVADVLSECAAATTVVAVGECGLDYHYDYSPRPSQREAFAAQITLAKARSLALVVHTREAFDDTLAILRSEGSPERVVFHCFTGGANEARRCLDAGGFLSFSGIVTFKNAADVREAALICPSDRLLVETDSPYLTPEPHRGRVNEPAFVTVVGAALARLRGATADDLAATTAENAATAFALAP